VTEASKIFKNIPCTFCGCLCDDIEIEVSNGEISEMKNGCAISKSRFLNHHLNRAEKPTIKENGTSIEVGLNDAISKAVSIISSARRLLVYGLSSTENDAHREAYKIAELVGGVVDNTSSVCHGPTILGVQESGEAAGALSEVRNRADLVIYWGSNPLAAHPRHISRYIRVPGAYISDPKKDRQIWLVDIRASETSRTVDKFIQIKPGTDLEVLSTLHALVRGHRLKVTEVGGVPIAELEEMAQKMKTSTYGILFFGLGLTQSKGRFRNIDAAVRLIQDLNSYTKWNMMPMRGHYNVSGANKTCTWQTGYPYAVDFARGYPRYQPGEYTAVDLLARGEVDALLNIAADPAAHFPKTCLETLSRIPVINLDPKKNMTSEMATVNIPTAVAGIECDGAAVRMDGLPLYLHKVLDPPEGILPDRDVLRMIYEGVEKEAKR